MTVLAALTVSAPLWPLPSWKVSGSAWAAGATSTAHSSASRPAAGRRARMRRASVSGVKVWVLSFMGGVAERGGMGSRRQWPHIAIPKPYPVHFPTPAVPRASEPHHPLLPEGNPNHGSGFWKSDSLAPQPDAPEAAPDASAPDAGGGPDASMPDVARG